MSIFMKVNIFIAILILSVLMYHVFIEEIELPAYVPFIVVFVMISLNLIEKIAKMKSKEKKED
ncbi:hypothetical protein [Aquibacillus rhizosphaerae]|uniref:Uncharacterized protein n=1 Tax=Aquibacillus rhizosphaerae TaxID=3051431 RepID=A0ABT7L2W5_9BACI|nr:hypothetical protein [Aquibacillus sp. LR5S19]MDL4840203.1 hypothetical protein [Aquibacillus sp. LR5S19]